MSEREELPGGFRRLAHPIRWVSGFPVCPLDKADAEWWGYRPDNQIKRPLVVGERVVTRGPMSDFRIGTVVKVDGDRATVDDDAGMWWYPRFDEDDRHGWSARSFAAKEVMDADGNWIARSDPPSGR